jgi:probable selenium-dependent hydroxylase accessory protein YqeC
MMELFTFLKPYLRPGAIITLVGAGGKSSTLYALARSAARRKIRTLLTTTTMMIDPALDPLARGIPIRYSDSSTGSYTDSPEAWILPPPERSLLFGASQQFKKQGKVTGLSPRQVDDIAPFWDLLIVEADGAKHRSIKAPAEHEPVIPEASRVVLGCIGIDSIGKRVNGETVHRPSHFCQVTGLREGDRITPQAVSKLACHRAGLFKNLPREASPIILLNKADMLDRETLQTVIKELSFCLAENRLPGALDASDTFAAPDVPDAPLLAVAMKAERPEDQIMLPVPQH